MNAVNVSIDEATAPVRPILEIKDLAITFKTGSGEVKAVKNAHLSIMPGETVAIVGESGSGKSTTALAAIGLLPGNGRVAGGPAAHPLTELRVRPNAASGGWTIDGV